MLFNIHFTKALVLVSVLGLITVFTLDKIIRNKRLHIFREYSTLTLPPFYEIRQNTAQRSNYRFDVWLVFGFDEKNYQVLLHQNKINTADTTPSHRWLKSGPVLVRKRNIGSHTILSETIDTRQKTLAFHFQQE